MREPDLGGATPAGRKGRVTRAAILAAVAGAMPPSIVEVAAFGRAA
jgi:hypothetical protein